MTCLQKDSDAQQQGGGDDTWQRGAKPSAAPSRSRDDIWDNVGDGSSDSNEMVRPTPVAGGATTDEHIV